MRLAHVLDITSAVVLVLASASIAVLRYTSTTAWRFVLHRSPRSTS